MNRRPLGRSEIVIEPLVLGGNVFGWTVDEKTGFAILDAFVGRAFPPSTPPRAIPTGCRAIRPA